MPKRDELSNEIIVVENVQDDNFYGEVMLPNIECLDVMSLNVTIKKITAPSQRLKREENLTK